MAALSIPDLLLIVLCAAVLFVPGLAVTRLAGLRGWAGVSAAPLVSYGIIATAGPFSSRLGADWTPVTFLVSTAALGGLCFCIRAWGRPRASATQEPEPDRDRLGDLVIAGGVLSGAILGGAVLLLGSGGLQAINQDWDASFHANAVRFIIDSGNADPTALAVINNYESTTFFYPNAYHALTAIVGQLTDASLPALLNAHALLVPGIAGLGLAGLIRAHRTRVLLAATVPILLSAFAAFPYDLLWRGPLLPYATGIALVPAFLVLFGDMLSTRRPAVMAVAVISAVGLLGLHPSAALTAAVLVLPMVAFRWLQRPASAPGGVIVILTVAVAATIVGLQFVLGALSAGGSSTARDSELSPTQAISNVLLLNHAAPDPQYWLVALIGVGLLGLTRIHQLWWWLTGTVIFILLFVTAAYAGPWAETVTQPWWNDRWRVVAVVALGLAVVAGHGVVMLADAAISAARRIPATTDVLRARVATGVAAVVVLSLVGVFSNGFYSDSNQVRVSGGYGDGPTVSTAEQEAMQALAAMVGPDERVMNDPGDGSAWMYALEGVRPVYGHVVNHGTGVGLGNDQRQLLSSFRCLDSSASVRELVNKYNIRYVFAGQGYVRSTFSRAPGLRTLGASPSLDLVYDQDGIRIYEIDMTAPNAASDRLECATTGS